MYSRQQIDISMKEPKRWISLHPEKKTSGTSHYHTVGYKDLVLIVVKSVKKVLSRFRNV
jgi:hypothetical protein